MGKKTYIEMDANYVTTQANTTGQFSEILEVRAPAGQELHFEPGQPLQILIQAHQQFTTDASADNAENFDITTGEIQDSPIIPGDSGTNGIDTSPQTGVPGDVVLYEAGSAVAPDSVRYWDAASNPNRIVYTDDGTGNTLDAYYLLHNEIEIEGRAYTANEKSYDNVFTGTTSLHEADVYNRNELFTWDNSFSIREDEKLKFFIHTDVDLTNWNSNTTDQSAPTSGAVSGSQFRLPAEVRDAPGRESQSRNRGFGVDSTPTGGRRRFVR